mmetsp:Transcript_22010/g.39445  ORF Transcript_22010/g.39445 Transcript_22010/m.39445 type:complete len:654 (-) Transcript_22010:75-2036(-)
MPDPPSPKHPAPPKAWQDPEADDGDGSRKVRASKSIIEHVVQPARTTVSENMARLARTRQLQNANRWVINPLRSDVRRWDFIMMLALVFVAIVTPVEVAMLDVHIDVLFFINRGVDLLFLLDMCLQLFLMYEVKTRLGVTLETRHSMIIKHYLKGWFIIDFVSILPFDLLGLVSHNDTLERAKLLKIIRQFRLFKLLRAVKASRFFGRLEENLSIAYHTLHLIKCIVILIISCHWTACAWALTLQLSPEPRDPLKHHHRWIDAVTGLEDNVDVKSEDSAFKLYVASAYFASYTMTSVGYGDISPRNGTERLCLLVLLFCSGLLWTYLLGEVCNVVAAIGAHEQEFRSTMDDLNFMMRDRALPTYMRKKLRRFFLSTRDVRQQDCYSMLFSKMSPALRGEIAWAMNHMWVTKVSFLKGMVHDHSAPAMRRSVFGTTQEVTPVLPTFEAFVVDIAVSLDTLLYAGEELFGAPHNLHILNRGLVGRMMRVLRSGAVWGEDFVLKDHTLQEPVQCHALTYVEVLVLSRDTFFDIVARHSGRIPGLEKQIRRFCVRLAAYRGILAEARRRAEKQVFHPDDAVKKKSNAAIAKLRTSVFNAKVVKAPAGTEATIKTNKEPASVARAVRKSIQELREQQSETDKLMKQLLDMHSIAVPDG